MFQNRKNILLGQVMVFTPLLQLFPVGFRFCIIWRNIRKFIICIFFFIFSKDLIFNVIIRTDNYICTVTIFLFRITIQNGYRILG